MIYKNTKERIIYHFLGILLIAFWIWGAITIDSSLTLNCYGDRYSDMCDNWDIEDILK